MKRTIKILLILAIIMFTSMTAVQAATTEDLVSYISQVFTIAGEKVTIPSLYVNTVKRYLKEYPVSEEDGDKIIKIAKKAENLLNTEGTYNPKNLSQAKKEELLGLVQEIAKIIDATITYNKSDKTIELYKKGKLYEALSVEMNKFKQTGSNERIYAISGVMTVATILGLVVYKRKK